MKTSFSILLMLLLSNVYADPQPWMKRENPNELGLFVSTTPECPFTEADITSMAEGEYVRARVKPTEDISWNLTLTVECMTTSVSERQVGWAMVVNLRFGTSLRPFVFVLYEGANYGTLAVGPDDTSGTLYLRNIVKAQVEEALTDYLKANIE